MLITAAVVLVIAAFLGVYAMRVAKLNSIKGRLEEVNRELGKLKPVVQRVNEIKNKKAVLDRKLGIIRDLMKARLLYPKLMEKFSSIMPPKAWITGLLTKTEDDNSVTLSINVLAKDNYGVADFINALEVAEEFSEIEFNGIRTVTEEGQEIRSFSIKCKYKQAEEKSGS